MTVAVKPSRVSYLGDGVTVTFGAPFRFLSASELQVTLVAADGTVSAPAFTAAGGSTDDGGTVTLGSAPAAGVKVRVWRETARRQPADYVNSDTFPTDTAETNFDRAMLIDQEQDDSIGEIMNRALMFPEDETAPVLPGADARKGKYLAFDADGNPVVAGGTGNDPDFRSDAAQETGSLLVGHKQLWSGAITTTVADKLRSLPHIYDLIPEANRNTSFDAAAALNTALASGERFVLPNTEIRFGSGLTLTNDNGGFIGQGKGSRLVSTFATGDPLAIGDGTNEISGVRFENFSLFSTVNRTGGAAIHATKCTDAEFLFLRVGSRDDDAAIGNYHYDGIYLDRFSDADIIGGEIVGKNELIKLRGNADQSIGAECTMGGGLLLYKGAVGVHVGGGCGGVKMESMDISIAATGLLIDQALTATYNREVIVQPACSIDSCTGNNIVIDQATSSVARFIFRGNWVAGSVGHGIWVKNANGARVFVSSMLYANGGDGLRIDDTNAYVVFAGEADINTGYGVNPTVTTSRLTMRPGGYFLGNTAGDFNRTYNPLVFDYATSKSLFKFPNYTVAAGPNQLPAPASAVDTFLVVTDALSPVAGSPVAGGGATRCVVWSDGANWRVVVRA